MKINSVNKIPFGKTDIKAAEQKPAKVEYDENPISKAGERSNIIKGTFLAGAGLALRLLWEVWDDWEVLGEKLANNSKKLVEKSAKNASPAKRLLLYASAATGIIGAAIGGFALLYTIFNAPKIKYEGDVNAFKKGKDMDVYIKGNKAEAELYTQMNEQAKAATQEEKEALKAQYMQLQASKNQLPDFIQKSNKL